MAKMASWSLENMIAESKKRGKCENCFDRVSRKGLKDSERLAYYNEFIIYYQWTLYVAYAYQEDLGDTSFTKAIRNDQVAKALAFLGSSFVNFFFCRSELMVGKLAGFLDGKKKKSIQFWNSTNQMIATNCQRWGFHNCHNRQ